MGNLCGKPSPNSEAFTTPGRTLSSAPLPPSGTAPLPSSKARNPNQPPRTLGGGGGGGGGAGATRSNTEDARTAAARAAEERAKANQPKGKLGAQLATQKQQTRTNTLEQASRDERRHRDADHGRQVQSWE